MGQSKDRKTATLPLGPVRLDKGDGSTVAPTGTNLI